MVMGGVKLNVWFKFANTGLAPPVLFQHTPPLKVMSRKTLVDVKCSSNRSSLAGHRPQKCRS